MRTAFQKEVRRKQRSQAFRRRMLNKTDGLCAYCGKELAASGRENAAFMEHVVPISQGGPDIEENIVASCQGCNTSKRNLTPDEWHQRPYRKLVSALREFSETQYGAGRSEAGEFYRDQAGSLIDHLNEAIENCDDLCFFHEEELLYDIMESPAVGGAQ